MTAYYDPEVLVWLMGIENGEPVGAGGFLRDLAQCALRADSDNYRILRPALLQIKAKYPQYKCSVPLPPPAQREQ
jgi:hypothetical protein